MFTLHEANGKYYYNIHEKRMNKLLELINYLGPDNYLIQEDPDDETTIKQGDSNVTDC